MIRSKILIFSALAVFLVLISSKKVFAMDEGYLKGRAVQLAGFSKDELVVEPQIVFNLLPSQFNNPAEAGSSNRVVNLLNPKFSPGGIVAVFKAPKYQVVDQTKSYTLFSFKRRVGDILTSGGVELAKEDIISPSRESQEPVAGNLIQITRVSTAEIEEFESVPYRVKKTNDPDINTGVLKVTKSGKNGRKRILYQVRRENGVEVSRILKSQEVVDEPQDQLISVGTKPVITVRCRFNDTVVAASAKYDINPDTICNLMMEESNGHADSANPDGYYGLFQYELGFWSDISAKAGYAGADWSDTTAQIYTTAYAFSHGYGGRW